MKAATSGQTAMSELIGNCAGSTVFSSAPSSQNGTDSSTISVNN